MKTLRRAKLYAKRSECSFFLKKVAYLGYIVSKEGLTADPAKIKAINQWPIPKSISEVRGFLGLTGWCRIFIQKYAIIASALTELLKKDEAFTWNEKRQEAFQQLKDKLSSYPVLKLPDFNKVFEAMVDACGQGIGGVLKQEGHPIAYES